ncbi:MAG: Rieske 2Fe-2S domain-containing protein, partial [Sphingobium limneticum]
DTRIILYRDPDGKAVAQSAYCAHLGADLSDGDIVEGQVRCPYHHWRYDQSGACSHIPTGVTPPRAIRIYNYPVAERWGLIWVFNGETPLYEVPTLDGTEDDYIFVARELPEQIQSDSWIQGTNGVDFQHLTVVHHMPTAALKGDVVFDDYTYEYRLEVMSADGKNRGYAANCIATHRTLPIPTNNYVIFATNAPKPGVSDSFWVAAVKQEPGESREAAEKRLAALDAFLTPFFMEDEYILNRIRFRKRGEAKLIRDDLYLGRFMDWLDRFPRHKPFDS